MSVTLPEILAGVARGVTGTVSATIFTRET